MTSTFATQFKSGSPKGICGMMEEVRRKLKQGKGKSKDIPPKFIAKQRLVKKGRTGRTK